MTFTGWKTRINPATDLEFVIDPYVDARLTCIAVIDESSQSNFYIQEQWNIFREAWPLRRFVLFTPTIYSGPEFLSPGSSAVWRPPNYDGISFQVRRDEGNPNFTTNWFDLTGLTNPEVDVKVALLYIDTSGSMTMETVLESTKLFVENMFLNDCRYKSIFDPNENWVTLFNKSMNDFGNL